MYITKNTRNNTRRIDLERLEERGASKELLEKVFNQTKDDGLEQARRQLVEAHRVRDVNKAEEIERYIRTKWR